METAGLAPFAVLALEIIAVQILGRKTCRGYSIVCFVLIVCWSLRSDFACNCLPSPSGFPVNYRQHAKLLRLLTFPLKDQALVSLNLPFAALSDFVPSVGYDRTWLGKCGPRQPIDFFLGWPHVIYDEAHSTSESVDLPLGLRLVFLFSLSLLEHDRY